MKQLSLRLPLIIGGIIFSIVFLMHLLRVVYNWQIMIAGWVVPMSVSTVALVVSAVLALWMFVAAAKK